MASKFFQEGSSSESSDDDDSVEEENQQNKQQGKTARDRMIKQHEDDDYKDQKRAKVVSEKEKKYGKMKEIIGKINEKLKIGDIDAVYNLFEELNKEIEKSKRVIQTAGVPNFYIRTITRLEMYFNNFTSEQKKKLSTQNNTAFNQLKHHMKKNNASYLKQIEEFKKNPVDTTQSEKSDSESEQEEKKEKQSDDSLSEKSDDSDSDKSDDEEKKEKSDFDPLRSNDPMIRRQFWLKKFDINQKKQETVVQKKKKQKKQKVDKASDSQQSEGDDIDSKPTKGDEKKSLINDLEYTPLALTARLKEITENRTKRNTKLQYEALTLYNKYIQNEYNGDNQKKLHCELLIYLVSIRTDLGKITSPLYIPSQLFNQTLENLQKLFKYSKIQGLSIQSYHSQKQYQENYLTDFIVNNISTLFQELRQAYIYIDQRSIDYVRRISEMYQLLAFSREVYKDLENSKNPRNVLNLTKIGLRRLEYTYYIHDNIVHQLRVNSDESFQPVIERAFPSDVNSEKEVHSIATQIYPNDETNRVRVQLYHIYHHAIHNRLSVAKDYLLMSKISQNIHSQDIQDQILYNRVLVQMGLASFRMGIITDTVTYLNDMCSHTFRTPQDPINPLFLGQQNQNTQDDKQQSIPYHQHINLELVDTVYLISSMLLEIPNILQGSASQIVYSKFFRKISDNYDRSQYNGCPDSYQDYIYAASRALKQGEWKLCFNLLNDIPTIIKHNYGQILKQNLEIRVKEQAFKSYIISFKGIFDSLSFEALTQKFELPSTSINSILYKMIYNKEINGSIGRINNKEYVVFEQTTTTQLQSLANNLLDRISQNLVNNQKISDAKVGNYGFATDDKQQEQNTQTNDGKHQPKREVQVPYNDKQGHKKRGQKH